MPDIDVFEFFGVQDDGGLGDESEEWYCSMVRE